MQSPEWHATARCKPASAADMQSKYISKTNIRGLGRGDSAASMQTPPTIKASRNATHHLHSRCARKGRLPRASANLYERSTNPVKARGTPTHATRCSFRTLLTAVYAQSALLEWRRDQAASCDAGWSCAETFQGRSSSIRLIGCSAMRSRT
jgi:hypothetical protein